MLASLLEGLRLIGINDAAAWQLVLKVAFDSMPAQRRKVIEHLRANKETTTKETATMLGLPTTTARRTLEDLAAHGLVRRREGAGPGEPDMWWLARWVQVAAGAGAVPEMSEAPISYSPITTPTDFSGTGSS
jgi:IclR helix-turn-helix domain